MKTRSFCFLSLLLSVLLSCTDGRQMRLQLAELERQNRADSLMTDDSLALVLANYFDRHGTANEQMRAHYILGRTYADLGEAPQALDEYHKAASMADTTAQDCDYKTLSRVHGQAAELFYHELLPYEMLEELKLGSQFALLAQDTVTGLIAYERQSYAYDLIGQKDSAINIIEKAFQRYEQYGYYELAANCAAPLMMYLVEQKKWGKAKQYMNIFEKTASYFEKGQVASGHETYYYVKGCYYLGTGKQDSAIYFFEKELNHAKDIANVEAAYKGLYHAYINIGKSDSAAKYADLCYMTSDANYRTSVSNELRHMQGLYNYQRNQLLAQKKNEEAEQTRLRLVVFVAFFVLFAGSCAFLLLYLYNRQIVTKRRLFAKYTYDIMQYLSAKKQLENLQHQNTLNEHLIWQAKEDLEFFRQSISEVRAKHADIEEWGLAETLMKTPIVERLKIQGTKGRAATDQELQALRRTANLYLPGFIDTLQSYGYHLTIKDISICILIKLNFTPYAICSIMQMTSPALSNLRKRLLKRMFNIDGSAPSFDDRIRDLSYEKQDVTR